MNTNKKRKGINTVIHETMTSYIPKLQQENKALKSENERASEYAISMCAHIGDLENEISALKEKNKQLVDALEYIRDGVIEKFEAWADGGNVDFKTICGAVIEVINNSMREHNPSHIFTPSKESNRFCGKCGKYLTDKIHLRSK